MLILSESTMTEPESTLTESGSKIRYYITKSITSQCALIMAHNVGSYTQGRTASDFLSSRKAAWAERCTPKTTAAALDG